MHQSGTLETWLRAAPISRPPLADVLNVFKQIAHGLHALHAAGVVHGALHFNNVFLNNGIPLLNDYGLLDEVAYFVSHLLITVVLCGLGQCG